MRRVDEFSTALVGFLANPSGQSVFHVEEAPLVVLNVHDVFRHDVANYLVGTASDTSAKAAFAQSSSFCTVGAPLSPIAPTTSPFTLMGNPPPHAATRASVGMPANSDGSPLIKLKKSCVETPNKAVYAFFCAISMVGTEAPSIRLKALRLPPSSRIATFSVTPSSRAFATAAFTIFCASSEEMLCFFTTLAIGHRPLLIRSALAPSNHRPVSLVLGLNGHVYSL